VETSDPAAQEGASTPSGQDALHDNPLGGEISIESPPAETTPIMISSIEKAGKSPIDPIYDKETTTEKHIISSPAINTQSTSSTKNSKLEFEEPQYIESLSLHTDLSKDYIEAKDMKQPEESIEKNNKNSRTFTPIMEGEEETSKLSSSKANSDDEEENTIVPEEMSIIEIASKEKMEKKNKKNQVRNGLVTPNYTENHTPQLIKEMEMEEQVIKPWEGNMEDILTMQHRVNAPDWAVNNYVAPDFMK